jgi:predicted Zn-dependent protease
MSYSRQQEVAADAAAIRFLNATHQSAGGMLKLFQILRRDETLNYGTIDPYAISHPLSEERIEHIRSEVMDADMPEVDKFADEHARMVAKLHGFLEKPEMTFLKYTDNSIPSLYARSIAYFQQSNFPKAFAELDKLLVLKPDDAFFNELKGQFLSESGHPQDAIQYYRKADKFYPNSALIKTELGELLINSNMTDEAITELSQSSRIDKTDTETWHLLAAAYGKKNMQGMSNLALAEEANTSGKNSEARQFARMAKNELAKNTPAWLRANDILADVKLHDKSDKDKQDEKNNS